MKPVFAVLPELDPQRLQRVLAPVLGKRHLVRIPGRQLQHPTLEDLARPHHVTLAGGQRRQLRASRTAREVRLRSRPTLLANDPVNPDLMTRGRPVEDQRRAPVVRQVAALATRVVGVEDERAVGQPLEENHARGRAFLSRRRERHRVRLGHAGFLRLAKPALEQHERIARRLFL